MEEKDINVNEESLKENEQKENSNKEEIKTETNVLDTKTLYERNDVTVFDVLYDTTVDNQTKFSTSYKKIRRISNIIMFTMMAIILVLLFVFGNNPTFIGVAIALVVVYLVGLFVSQKKIKDKLNIESTKGVNDYFTNLDSYITRDTLFSDVKFNQTKKLEENTFKDLRICKDIIQVTARDYIEGKLLSYNFVAGDNCVKTREKKENGSTQDYIVFLGKLFVLDAKLVNDEQRAIIYLKGKGANGPTDIDDLTLQEEVLSEKYAVYSNFDVNTILNDEIKLVLEQFEVNDYLVDMFITINNSKLAFGFSYNDGIMVVPLTNPVGKNDIKEYKKDVELMVEIVEHLKKED